MSVTLHVDGAVYGTWQSVHVSAALKRGCSHFQLEAPGAYFPAIAPFMACVVSEDGEPVLSGYVDDVHIDVSARESRTVITGRSRVMDMVDCMPEFATNQFNGYALDAIARTLGEPFGVSVSVMPGAPIGEAFADATFERSEKAFAFVARLARQRGILPTDNGAGELVLATLGTARAPAPLMMGPGGNVFQARGSLCGKDRYSKYGLHSQAGMKATGSTVQNAVSAVAYDYGVPRYRPWGGIAESACLPDAAQIRANWEAAHRCGLAVKAVLSVPGWRAGAALWQCNQLVACDVPRLGLGGDMLVSELAFIEDAERGQYTEVTVQPPSAFTPDPAQLAKGRKQPHAAKGDAWSGIVSVNGAT